MATLFSYTVRVDDGAAPNPFGGMCTLAICKPSIRRAASRGDWVVGLGSANAPNGNLSGRVVYAMCVERVLTLAEYDRLAPENWPLRIPDIDSLDMSRRLGDCIYDYSAGSPPKQRPGVHGERNIKNDLGGENVLISTDFYYFGSRAYPLPDHLLGICHQTQGHKSKSNALLFRDFETWIRGLGLAPGQLYGWPDYIVDWSLSGGCGGCVERQQEDENDFSC